jgi:hypothetical protein
MIPPFYIWEFTLLFGRMPVEKWLIEPTRLVSPASFSDQNGYKGADLSDTINASLATIIKQLSCIAEYTEMMFGELILESQQLVNRTNNLSGKVTVLKQYVSQLNPVVDEGQCIHVTLQFTKTF